MGLDPDEYPLLPEIEENKMLRLPSDLNGYTRSDFYVGGREAIVVAPKAAAPGRLFEK